jgi:CheY-like chemotaxis protein/HPt (histidine-containing phosphotransfer) domain-containing protein
LRARIIPRRLETAHAGACQPRPTALDLALYLARPRSPPRSQVLVNLVSNAIKFTPPEGNVHLQVQVDKSSCPSTSVAGRGGVDEDGNDPFGGGEEHTRDRQLVRLIVRDTGIGIEPVQQARVFEKYRKIDHSGEEEVQGKTGSLGLGLYLCKMLVGHMGGRIWLESTPGVGTTVYVEMELEIVVEQGSSHSSSGSLPVTVSPNVPQDDDEARAVAIRPLPTRVGKVKRVLIVDDNQFNQEVAGALLEADGHTVSVAPDGAKALQAIAYAREAGLPFDVCLMDVNMPVKDGMQATRELREIELTTGSHHLLVIALTAYTSMDDCERCKASGMDLYLSKPLEMAVLRRYVEPAASVTEVAKVEEAPVAAAALPPVRAPPQIDASAIALAANKAVKADIDYAAMLVNFGGNESLAQMTLQRFKPAKAIEALGVIMARNPPHEAQDIETPYTLPAGISFVICDDDDIPRIVAGLLLTQAAANHESLILGETYEEVAGLVERVLEMAARRGDERVVCVLDENLDGYSEGAFTGTGLVRELRERGFRGLCVIQSANDEPEHEKAYLANGADGSIGKAIRGGVPAMLAILSRLYHARSGVQHSSSYVPLQQAVIEAMAADALGLVKRKAEIAHFAHQLKGMCRYVAASGAAEAAFRLEQAGKALDSTDESEEEVLAAWAALQEVITKLEREVSVLVEDHLGVAAELSGSVSPSVQRG